MSNTIARSAKPRSSSPSCFPPTDDTGGGAEKPVLNAPTQEGRELGEMLARFVEIERERDPTLREPCFDCAFRKGAAPNAMPATLMTALKCVFEREPFYCHLTWDDGRERLCAGWEALVVDKGAEVSLPWDYVAGFTDPSVVQMGHAPEVAPEARATAQSNLSAEGVGDADEVSGQPTEQQSNPTGAD